MPLIRLLGIGALAALAALLWLTAGASAQQARPTIEVQEVGWADSLNPAGQAQIKASLLTVDDIASGSDHRILGAGWTCATLKCHYVHVSWSGFAPLPTTDGGDDKPGGYNIYVTRRAPTAAALGVADNLFGFTNAPIAMALRVPAEASEWYVPVPWPGERVYVLMTGHDARGKVRSSRDSADIPAIALPASFTAKPARSEAQFGATLVENPIDRDLSTVMVVWREIDEVTHYEVQYTFRTRSLTQAQRLTRVTRNVMAGDTDIADKENEHEGETHYVFEGFTADWNQLPNADVLNGLTNLHFGEQAHWKTSTIAPWMGVLTVLPKLLTGREGWPDGDELDAEVTQALKQGRNAVGVRIRPMLACSFGASDLCPDNAWLAGPLAQRGAQSQIAYVRFEGDDVEDWLESIGFIIP